MRRLFEKCAHAGFGVERVRGEHGRALRDRSNTLGGLAQECRRDFCLHLPDCSVEQASGLQRRLSSRRVFVEDSKTCPLESGHGSPEGCSKRTQALNISIALRFRAL
jgi:hypothetical protein